MNIKAKINNAKLKVKKNSPQILVIGGVVGMVSSAVMACKATRKIDPILDAHKEGQKKLHEARQNEEFGPAQIKKSTVKLYMRTGMAFAKLYGPSVILGGLSIGCIFASNNIMRKRNASLAAAYASLDKLYKEYRARVVDRFGEETDYELLHGVKTVTEEVTDDKGKVKKKEHQVVDPNAASDYVKYITRSNPYWEENEDFLLSFLNAQQNFANDKLKAEGSMVLNQVYEALGFEKTKAGMVVGWVINDANPSGDNFIQFKVRKCEIPCQDGVSFEPAYSIDFNVDGCIYDLV